MAKKILIVDDSELMRVALHKILTTNGYEIVGEAESCEDAMVKFKTLAPDLVILDVIMPGVSGLETLQALIILDSNAKVMMLTVIDKQSMVVEAIHAGAKGFLTKPFHANTLLAEVKRILDE